MQATMRAKKCCLAVAMVGYQSENFGVKELEYARTVDFFAYKFICDEISDDLKGLIK